MKAYTYFNHVPNMEDVELLALWKMSWHRHGWEPVIMGEADAERADPAMTARFRVSPLLKTRNPPAYTLAAMLRWVAMTGVKEPAIHVDWDVLCNGFRPEDAPKEFYPPVFLQGSFCPSGIFTDGSGWERLCAILELAPSFTNFNAEELAGDSCDQYAFSKMPRDWAQIDPRWPIKFYQEDAGWQMAPMVHFPNRLTKYPRSRSVKEAGFTL